MVYVTNKLVTQNSHSHFQGLIFASHLLLISGYDAGYKLLLAGECRHILYMANRQLNWTPNIGTGRVFL